MQMPVTSRPWRLALPLLILGGAFGCGGDADEGVTVEGKVAYQGEPITNGSLTFFPASGRPITAALSEDGEYSCQLPPGEYRVTVTVGVMPPAGWKEGDPVPPPSIVLPDRYGSRLETPLTATVTAASGTHTVDFPLE
jgi:hypothetical protein